MPEKHSKQIKPAKPKRTAKKPSPTGKRGGVRPGAGRPAGSVSPEKKALRELAQAHTEDAVGALAGLCNDAAQPGMVRVSAACALLDRGHGRPTQSVELEVSTPFTQAEKDALEGELRTGYESLKASGFWLKQKAEMRERKRLLNEDKP